MDILHFINSYPLPLHVLLFISNIPSTLVFPVKLLAEYLINIIHQSLMMQEETFEMLKNEKNISTFFT